MMTLASIQQRPRWILLAHAGRCPPLTTPLCSARRSTAPPVRSTSWTRRAHSASHRTCAEWRMKLLRGRCRVFEAEGFFERCTHFKTPSVTPKTACHLPRWGGEGAQENCTATPQKNRAPRPGSCASELLEAYRFPRRSCSSSSDSNSALKFPFPKLWLPRRQMISMKKVGRSWRGLVKSWRR